ncbi:MAG: hypothetical protein ABEJ56_05140 [Candidatus Nanohaloarchaea archaeon]
MSEKELDEFDRKAKKFLEADNFSRLENILKEFALCEGYSHDVELDNPERIINEAGVNVGDIDDFTKYQVAKNVIRRKIKMENGKKGGVFGFLKS